MQSLIEGTRAEVESGNNGVGVHAGFNSLLTMTDTLVLDSVAAGVALWGAQATLGGNVVRSVAKGKLTVQASCSTRPAARSRARTRQATCSAG